MSNEIVSRELRFAIHVPANGYDKEDLHYVKEVITDSNGLKKPKISVIKEYKRPVWITGVRHRNHIEKKEFEDIDKLVQLSTTQSNMNMTVARALDKTHLIKNPRELKNSPYIYGYDITSTSLLKLRSLSRNKFVQSSYSVAAFDIETDIDTKEIILATIVMKDKAYTVALAKFFDRSVDVINRINKALELYLEKYKGLDYKVEIFESEVELLKAVFKKANEWSPDFLAIWNMDYDIPFILDRLKLFNVDPIDVLCDPNLDRKYRICVYKQGIKKKVTASGVVKPINPSMQWHTLVLTAPFYVIDSMCTFRQLRISEQELSSYSLDNVLKVMLKTEKLKFKEADHLSGAEWHKFMQKFYPIEYTIYNLYDCLSMLELDEKTKDLSNSLPSFAGITDFSRFNSNPKKIVDALFRFALEKNKIIGTVGTVDDKKDDKASGDEDDAEYETIDDEDDEDEEEDVKKYSTLSLKRWIITLPQHLLYNDGLCCIEENPNMVTNIRGLVYDIDVVSSYPSCTDVLNVSKTTTENEVISIEGKSETLFREQNLGIIAGSVNSLEYCNKMLNLPNIDQILNIM